MLFWIVLGISTVGVIVCIVAIAYGSAESREYVPRRKR